MTLDNLKWSSVTLLSLAIAVILGDAAQAMESKRLDKSLEAESSQLAKVKSDRPPEPPEISEV